MMQQKYLVFCGGMRVLGVHFCSKSSRVYFMSCLFTRVALTVCGQLVS